MADVGIILSGGMAKGAYQIGVINALSEYFSQGQIKAISAASVGVLNGYAFAAGKMDAAEALWREIHSSQKTSGSFITSMLRSDYLQEAIGRIASEEDTLSPSLFTTLLNVSSLGVEYVDIKKVPPSSRVDYLRASVAMPGFNRSVLLNEQKYFDGAMIDNIPVHPFIQKKLDYIICVHFDAFNYTFESEYLNSRILKITFPADHIVRNSVFFREDSIRYMIQTGYQNSKILFDSVFSGGTEDVEGIYKSIARLNHSSGPPSLRITGDVVVNNLNKVTRRIARRKKIYD
ncbi:MAG: hypothetical protein IJY82_05165 [Oscillospiraceae bacterium]|nr:hypothetical protein [Oscillospiraceae bacterium]